MKLLTLLVVLPCTLLAGEPDLALREARRYVTSWLGGLDDIVCLQSAEHYSAEGIHDWRLEGRATSELTFRGGVEHYALFASVSPPRGAGQLAGPDPLDSRSEFGTAVWLLFNPASKATFHRGGAKEQNGRRLRRFSFEVRKKDSRWEIGVDRFTPAYTGAILVDEADGSLHWLEMEALQFPSSSYIRAVRLQLRFSTVELDGLPRVLPESSELRICTRRCFCQQRKFQFSQYRRFTATSKLIPQ